MKKAKQLLSYLMIVLGLIGISSLYFSLLTNIETNANGAQRLRGFQLFENLFAGNYASDGFYTFLFTVYMFFIGFQIAFIVVALLKMFGKKVNLRVLKVLGICLTGFAVLTFASCIVIASNSTVITSGTYSNIYHLGTGTYLLLISSIIQLVMAFSGSVYEVLSKK